MAEKKTVLLRVNPEIWEEISRWAEEEFRSVNGQIEYLLNEAVNRRKKTLPAPPSSSQSKQPPGRGS